VIGQPTNREALGLLAGFGLWSLAFGLLYGAHGAICATGMLGETGARAVLIGLWVAVIAALAALVPWLLRRLRAASHELRFVRLASLTLTITALGATVWIGLPTLALRLC
jgi:hypothetical protein